MAEESLDAVRHVGVGTGSYKPDFANQLIAFWTRTMTGAPAPRPAKPTPADLRTMGIGVRRQKKQKATT